jgi:fatty acid desaturase
MRDVFINEAGDKSRPHSRPDLAKFIKRSRPNTVRSIVDILVLCWASVGLSAAMFLRFPSVRTYAIVFMVLSSRMNACLTLAHDAWHCSLSQSRKWNNFFGAWLCSYPFGSVYGTARAGHLAHHRYLGTGADPDRPLHLETGKETPAQFVAHFLKHMLVGQLVVMVSEHLKPVAKWRKILADTVSDRRQASIKKCSKYPEFANIVLMQGAIAAVLWFVSGHVWMYLAVWFLPITTIGTLCYFLRAFADHARLATDPEGPREGRLVTISNQLPWERAFIAPFQFNFHAEHHLYPSVPHQYLPQLHAMMIEIDAYWHDCIVRRSYSGFLWEYWRQIRRPSTPGSQAKTEA